MSNVLLEMKDRVAVIASNRPKALNALSTEVLSDLNSALAEVCQTKSIYALIVTGAGEKELRGRCGYCGNEG